MKKTVLIIFLFCSLVSLGQDWSSVGKSIVFSDTLNNAKKFTDIDKALADPAKVYYLELYVKNTNDPVRKFSEHIQVFKNLRKLVLINRGGPLVVLPGTLWSLNKLEYLCLGNFPGLSTAGINKLTQLKYLSLDGIGLKEVPTEVLELNKLEYLDFSCNFLSVLPAAIEKLQHLREIELTNNCFTRIPPELVLLPKLVYITINNAEQGAVLADGTKVCNNSMSEVPDYLGKTKSIRQIGCFFKVPMSKELKKKLKAAYPKIRFG